MYSGSQMMYPNGFGNLLTFPSATKRSAIVVLSEMSWQLLDGHENWYKQSCYSEDEL